MNAVHEPTAIVATKAAVAAVPANLRIVVHEENDWGEVVLEGLFDVPARGDDVDGIGILNRL